MNRPSPEHVAVLYLEAVPKQCQFSYKSRSYDNCVLLRRSTVPNWPRKIFELTAGDRKSAPPLRCGRKVRVRPSACSLLTYAFLLYTLFTFKFQACFLLQIRGSALLLAPRSGTEMTGAKLKHMGPQNRMAKIMVTTCKIMKAILEIYIYIYIDIYIYIIYIDR